MSQLERARCQAGLPGLKTRAQSALGARQAAKASGATTAQRTKEVALGVELSHLQEHAAFAAPKVQMEGKAAVGIRLPRGNFQSGPGCCATLALLRRPASCRHKKQPKYGVFRDKKKPKYGSILGQALAFWGKHLGALRQGNAKAVTQRWSIQVIQRQRDSVRAVVSKIAPRPNTGRARGGYTKRCCLH